MSESNELHANQSENVDFENLTQTERMVLQMFRNLIISYKMTFCGSLKCY